jgi:hypothetical protein
MAASLQQTSKTPNPGSGVGTTKVAGTGSSSKTNHLARLKRPKCDFSFRCCFAFNRENTRDRACLQRIAMTGLPLVNERGGEFDNEHCQTPRALLLRPQIKWIRRHSIPTLIVSKKHVVVNENRNLETIHLNRTDGFASGPISRD